MQLIKYQPVTEILSTADAEVKLLGYLANAKSPNTLRAYKSDWEHFSQWCAGRRRTALPATPKTVALYLATYAETKKASTLRRRLAAIAKMHRLAGKSSPTTSAGVKEAWAGISRTLGTAMVGKTPLLLDDLRRILDALPATLPCTRDRALLLLGFAAALRRSELVGLDVADLEFVAAGLIVHLRRSKTDTAGAGREIGIPLGQNAATCPVAAVKAWLLAGDVGGGPVFRAINKYGRVAETRLSDRAVAKIVQRSAEAAGLDKKRFAGHSMRSGLATQAAMNGVPEADIQRQTGHRSVAMLRRYVRLGSLFLNNASGKIGL